MLFTNRPATKKKKRQDLPKSIRSIAHRRRNGKPLPSFFGGKVRHNIGIDNWGFFIGLVPLPYSPAFGTSVYIQYFIYIFYKNTELVPLRESTIWGKIATSIYSTYGPKGVSERDRFKSTE